MDKKEIRKRKKGFFALLMALLFLFTSLPVDVLAASYEILQKEQVVLKGDTIYVYVSGDSLKYAYDDGGVATEEPSDAEPDTSRYYHVVKNIQPSGAPYPYGLWSVKELDTFKDLYASGALRINTLTLTPVDSFLTIEGEISSTSGTKTTINWTITVNPKAYVWNGGVTVVNEIPDAFTDFTEYSGDGITVSVSPDSAGVTPTVTEGPSENPGTETPGASPGSEGVTPTAFEVKWADLTRDKSEWAYTISEFSSPTARRYVLNFTTVVDMADRSAAEDVESWASLKDLGLSDKGICTVPVPTHTVTFDANGHGTAPAKIENVAHGSKITAPTDPSETGWTFDGWCKESGCTNAWNFNEDTVTEDTTLYAKWTQNTYTVTFNANGHGTAPTAIGNVAHGSKITAPDEPTETGWTFGGWFKESGCTNPWNFDEDTVTGNTTLYAKWKQNTYTVTFDANDHGTAPAAIRNVTHGSKITAPDEPTATGWTFEGWYKESGCTNPWNFDEDTVTGNTTLYAKWTQKTHTVTYDAATNGGTTTAVAVSVAEGAPIDLDQQAEKEGWKFRGWATSANASSLAPRPLIMGEQDVTLYAQFFKELNVKFYSADQVADETYTLFNNETSYTARMPAPKYKDGWNDVGWTGSANKYTKDHFTGDEVSLTGDTEFFAIYKKGVVVTYDVGGGSPVPAREVKYRYLNVHQTDSFQDPTFDIAAAPTKLGASFNGWHVGSPDGETVYAAGTTGVKFTENTTLYAGWTPQTGSLSIAMNIANGYASDKDTDFRYTVKLTNAEEGFAGTYGDLTFTDAEATFTLKDGQSVTAANLPAGLTFTVEQKGNPFFATTSTGASGTVPADETASAAFVNTQKTSIAPKTQTLVADGDDGSVRVEGTDTLDGSFEYFYQWYKGKTNGEVIDGAGSETLNVPAGTEAGTTYYYCEILAKFGDDDEFTVTTDPAEVIVVEPVNPCFAGHSLVLSGTIGVNFYMDLPKAAQLDYSDSSMELTVQGVTTTIPLDANVPQVAQDSGKYYRFTCYVNSVQMADEITAVFHYRQKGEAAEVTDTYSVKRYVEASENMNFSEQTVALIRAIADYGHYAQPYLAAQNGWTVGEKHEEMDKYYAAYTEADVKKAWAGVADMGIKASRGKWIDKVSLSLTLESNTMLNIYFTPVSGYTGTPTATVDGQTAEVQTLEDGRFRVSIPDIEAYRLGNKYNIRLKTGSYVTTVQVSAMSFVKAVLDKTKTGVITDEVNAVVALYKYCKAVQAYR